MAPRDDAATVPGQNENEFDPSTMPGYSELGDPNSPFAQWLKRWADSQGLNWDEVIKNPKLIIQARTAFGYQMGGGYPDQGGEEGWGGYSDSPFTEQGSNPDMYGVGGDAWSNSVPWRQQAPTGGLYGALSGQAGGYMTPYEQNWAGGWQDLAQNPMSAVDLNNLGLSQWFASGNLTEPENEFFQRLKYGALGGPNQGDYSQLQALQPYTQGMITPQQATNQTWLNQIAGGQRSGDESDFAGYLRGRMGAGLNPDEADIYTRLMGKYYGSGGLTPAEEAMTGSLSWLTKGADLNDPEKQGYDIYKGMPNPTDAERGTLGGWQSLHDQTPAGESGAFDAYGKMTSTPGQYVPETANAFLNMTKTPGMGQQEAFDAYKGMTQSGYSDAEKNAIAQEGMNATRAGFDNARAQMARQAAAQGSSTGYMGGLGQLARGQTEALGQQARQNEIQFANEAERRKETGAQGLTNVAGLAQTREAAGASGLANAAALAQQRENQGAGGLLNTAAQGTARQQGALQGQGGWEGQQRQNAAQGAAGLSGLGQGLRQGISTGANSWQNLVNNSQGRVQFGLQNAANLMDKMTGRQQTATNQAQQLLENERQQQLAALNSSIGLGQQQVQNQQWGLGQQQNWLDTQRNFQNQQLQEALGMLGNLRNYQQWGGQQGQNWSNDQFNRVVQGLTGMGGVSQFGRNNQNQGLQGLLQMYAQNDPLKVLGLASGIGSTLREQYGMGADTAGSL